MKPVPSQLLDLSLEGEQPVEEEQMIGTKATPQLTLSDDSHCAKLFTVQRSENRAQVSSRVIRRCFTFILRSTLYLTLQVTTKLI